MRELTRITVTRVDAVDRPANQRKFLLFKSKDGEPDDAAAKAAADADKSDADKGAATDDKSASGADDKSDGATGATVDAEALEKMIAAAVGKATKPLLEHPAFVKAETEAKAAKLDDAIKMAESLVTALKALKAGGGYSAAPQMKDDDAEPVAAGTVAKQNGDAGDASDDEDVSDDLVKMLEAAEKANDSTVFEEVKTALGL